jgi:hypothetical protein
MKALQVVTAVVFLTFAGLAATIQSVALQPANTDSAVVTHQVNNDNDELFERFETSLVYGLSSDVIGVVESSIYNAINYKVAYPEFASGQVEEMLNRVAVEGENHSLRYRAYLALAYYKNQSEFDSPDELLSLLDYSYQDGIFFYLQETVQSGQFTSNVK